MARDGSSDDPAVPDNAVDGWIRDLFREIFPGPPMQIFVKSIAGKTIVLDIDGGFYEDDIKLLIEQKEGIAHSDQVITFGGRPLNKKLAVMEQGITSGATLQLSTRLRGGSRQPFTDPFEDFENEAGVDEQMNEAEEELTRIMAEREAMEISVYLPDGTVVNLAAWPHFRVEVVRWLVCEQLTATMDSIRMYTHTGEEMADGLLIAEYNIQPRGDMIAVVWSHAFVNDPAEHAERDPRDYEIPSDAAESD